MSPESDISKEGLALLNEENVRNRACLEFISLRLRSRPDEGDAFRAGWSAAKEYFTGTSDDTKVDTIDIPVPMLLFCPRCAFQHVDEPQPEKNWFNPPHRSHECQGCGHVWRPADIATTGVLAISTRGKVDGDPAPQSLPKVTAERDDLSGMYDEAFAANAALVIKRDALSARVKELTEALTAVQWDGHRSFRCIECDGQPSIGHIGNCRVGRALIGKEPSDA